MHIDKKHIKLNTKAEIVEGILFPIAIIKAITNHETPKSSTWIKTCILAFQIEANNSRTFGGKCFVRIIKIMRTSATTKISKKNKLRIKLIIWRGKELESEATKPIFTSAEIIRSWYISSIYQRGMLKKRESSPIQKIFYAVFVLNMTFINRVTTKTTPKMINMIGKKKSFAKHTWRKLTDLNPYLQNSSSSSEVSDNSLHSVTSLVSK